jgi:hypothetical protein
MTILLVRTRKALVWKLLAADARTHFVHAHTYCVFRSHFNFSQKHV